MKNKKALIGIIAVIAVIAVFAAAYIGFSPKATQGSKNITIEVINSAEESTVYEVATDAEYLVEAFKDADGLEVVTEEGQYGVFILSVNGEEAVWETNNAYWSIMVNGEYGQYGASEQVVTDGDAFQLVYTKG